MSAKMDLIRADMRPGDGVMVRTKADPEEWDWGYIMMVTGTGFLVDIWEKTGKYQRMCDKQDVFPDDVSWEDIADDIPFKVETGVSMAAQQAIANANANKVVDITGAKSSTSLLTDLPEDETYVFVYGTLKKGGRLNKHLADAEFIGKDRTAFKKYTMFSVSEMFPAVTDHKGTCSIDGEVYKITPKKVALLDEVEGVPFLYRREKCWCKDFDKQCYIYVASLRTQDTYELERGDRIRFNKDTDSLSWKN